MQIGNIVSNFISLAVASSGSSCSDPSGVSSTALTQFSANGGASVGNILYQTYSFTSPGFSFLGGGNSVTSGTQELASFSKLQFQNVTALAPVLNAGACSVYSFNGTAAGLPGLLSSKGLDAGPAITLTGGGSTGALNPVSSTSGVYTSRFKLISGTTYTFTGPGGKDVGSFSVGIPLSQETLAWTNESATTTVQRANGTVRVLRAPLRAARANSQFPPPFSFRCRQALI